MLDVESRVLTDKKRLEIWKNRFLTIAYNLTALIVIFLVLVVIRYPVWMNAERFMDGDEAFMGAAILEWIRGAPFFFYYEGVTYHGILGGLTAVPLFRIFGENALAFKLPGTIYYSLYIWSSFHLVKQFNSSAAWITGLLMLFAPVEIFSITIRNWPHVDISFLGNLIFLLFVKSKYPAQNSKLVYFFLGVVMGFAVYQYTLSVLHVFTVLTVLLVTHPAWASIRESISIQDLKGAMAGFVNKRQMVARVFDVIIVIFTLAILFSYTFGGFGLDIAGISILQVNKLHKPVGQLMLLILIRTLIHHKDLKVLISNFKEWFQNLPLASRNVVGVWSVGFLIGLLPRIWTIVTGQVTRGGTGFDMDFLLSKLINHFWEFWTVSLPDVMGIRSPIINLVSGGGSNHLNQWISMLSIPVAFLVVWSICFFYYQRIDILKKVITLQPVPFKPEIIFLVFPLWIIFSLTVTQHGPLNRYLFPLYGVIAIWVGLFLQRCLTRSAALFSMMLACWVGFYLLSTYQFYKSTSALKDFTVVKRKEPLLNVIQFVKNEKIRAIYAPYSMASKLAFYSRGEFPVAEFHKSSRGKRRKARAAGISNFSVVIHSSDDRRLSAINDILQKNGITFQVRDISDYLVYWDFQGNPSSIDQLRNFYD